MLRFCSSFVLEAEPERERASERPGAAVAVAAEDERCGHCDYEKVLAHPKLCLSPPNQQQMRPATYAGLPSGCALTLPCHPSSALWFPASRVCTHPHHYFTSSTPIEHAVHTPRFCVVGLFRLVPPSSKGAGLQVRREQGTWTVPVPVLVSRSCLCCVALTVRHPAAQSSALAFLSDEAGRVRRPTVPLCKRPGPPLACFICPSVVWWMPRAR